MIDEGDKRVSGRPKAQTQLNFTENQQEASSLATLTNVTSAESPLISTKRPYEDLEQVHMRIVTKFLLFTNLKLSLGC